MTTIQVPRKLLFLFYPARFKVARGGRGGAKSRAFAAALTARSIAGKERILCCREIQKSIKDSVKKLIENEIERRGWGHLFTVTRDSVICEKTGSEFIFAGLRDNVDSIKSMEGVTLCWVEEAHTMSQRSLDILVPTIREPGSELWFSYNPQFETDPVHTYFNGKNPPPGAVIVDINYTDNPWFPAELREQMEWDMARDYDKYRHVWLGECVRYSDEQVMHGVWRVAETPEPPDDTILRYGLDFGFSVSPTAAVRLWIDGASLYIDHEVYGHGVDIDDTPALLKAIPGIDRWPIKADSARPESISYLNKKGFRVVAAKKGTNSIEDGIARLRGYDITIHPRCKHLIEEFTRYSYKRDKQTDEILPIIIDEFNDGIDACRYATEGVQGVFMGVDLS